MPACAIINCRRTTKPPRDDKDISFHRFPEDPDLKELWIDATGRKNWTPTKHSRICSLHFVDRMFTCNTGVAITKYRRLHNAAIPTIDVVKISNEQVNFTPTSRTFKLVPNSSTSKTQSSTSEDSNPSENEIEKVLIKEEPVDNEDEDENQLTDEETVIKKPKLGDKITIEKTATDKEKPDTCNTVLIPEDFMKTIFQTQTDVLNALKSQVLLQDPDPQLFTFLRFLGAKLQMLPLHKRRTFQDKVTGLVLQEYFDG